jgi:hypothetical protein
VYDFWFTLGTATIKPALLDAIQNAGPVFDFVQRIIVEIEDGEQTLRPSAPSAGLLENTPTTAVRAAIAKYVGAFSPAAPPIGIYCAGRLSQLMKIPFFSSTDQAHTSFRDIIKLANQAYVKGLAGGAESKLPSFPAFLGLCLVDGQLVEGFENPGADVKQIVSEFGISVDSANREWQIATAFADTDEFASATQLLMLGNMNPWRGTTLEQVFFWDGLSEHAIP